MKRNVTAVSLLIIAAVAFLCAPPAFSAPARSDVVVTSEGFRFMQVHQKSLKEYDVAVRVGIGKTRIKGVSAIYFELENRGGEAFPFNPSEIRVRIPSGKLMTTAEYTLQYEGRQAGNIISKQGTAPYEQNHPNHMGTNTDLGMAPNTWIRQDAGSSYAIKQISAVNSGIRSHELPQTISFLWSGDKKYYYMFVKGRAYPVVVKYKELSYELYDGKRNGVKPRL